MVVALRIKDDLDQLERVLHRHERSLMKKAVPQAVNRTVRTVQSKTVKQIAGVTGIKQKDVRAAMKTTKANAKDFDAAIDAREGRAKNLIELVRPAQRNPHTFRQRTKKGFKYAGVKAKAWGQAKVYNTTFIGAGKNSGKLLVLKRTGGSGSKVESVRGPSIRREFTRPEVTAMQRRVARQRLRIELSASINHQIQRLK